MIEFIRDVQPYIFRYPTIIGIEVPVVPLILGIRSPFFVIPVIVNADGDYIFLSIFYMRCQVETDGHNSVLVEADVFAIDIEISTLTYTFKFDKDFFLVIVCGEAKMFPIPYDGICQLFDAQSESFVFIESIR